MILHDALLPVFLLMTAASAVPGPSDLLVMSLALQGGVWRAIRVIPGILCADAVFIFFASTGWMALSAWLPEGAGRGVRLIGYLYLLWICGRLFAAKDVCVQNASTSAAPTAFLGGFFITLSDPTAIAFYAALLPMITRGRKIGFQDALILFACAACAITLVKVSYACLAVRLGRPATGSPNAGKTRKALAIIMTIMTILFLVRDFL